MLPMIGKRRVICENKLNDYLFTANITMIDLL